jgi:glutamine synthetase
MRKAEYIWIDGTKPTPQLRSKTKILYDESSPPIWGFDGSSTNQADGSDSDCVLSPVFTCKDPIREGDHILVLCEVLNTDMTPHQSNTRRDCVSVCEEHLDEEPLFGMEQEYTFYKDGRPLGFPERGFPAPQGPYYCSVGATKAFGRIIVERHLEACLRAGLRVSGINAEVMPGQWEFQIGPVDGIKVADQIWVARWLLERIAEDYDVDVSYDAKPVKGDWNGAGCHTNFSTKSMRDNPEEGYSFIIAAAGSLEESAKEHIEGYGDRVEDRLTGDHETCAHNEFRYGVSDRGASVRIPWQVAEERKGYLEDRRPNANCDPYVVARLIIQTICGKKRGF